MCLGLRDETLQTPRGGNHFHCGGKDAFLIYTLENQATVHPARLENEEARGVESIVLLIH